MWKGAWLIEGTFDLKSLGIIYKIHFGVLKSMLHYIYAGSVSCIDFECCVFTTAVNYTQSHFWFIFYASGFSWRCPELFGSLRFRMTCLFIKDVLHCLVLSGMKWPVCLLKMLGTLCDPRTLVTWLVNEELFGLCRNLVTCLSVSMDGTLLLSGSHDETVRLWDIQSKQSIRCLTHKGTLHPLI